MKEEYDRLVEAEHVYRQSIRKESQGSPRIKHIGNKDYLYLEKREGKRVVYKYIGVVESKKACDIMVSVKRRKKDQEALKRIRNDLKDVKKVLRGKI